MRQFIPILTTAVALLLSHPALPQAVANPAAAAPESPALVTCPAGSPLGAVDLKVQAGDQRLPFRTINHLTEGDTVLYAPVIRGKEKRSGEVALVLVPAKREPGKPDILVTDPKSADKPQDWKMTETISVAALVYGPSGLNKKKIAKFLLRDEVLVAQLADYANKTAQAEQLVSTLSNSESSSATVNAALNGFASEYGFAVQIDRNAPIQSQAAAVFAAMNPQLASYNPAASSTAQRVGQSASLATMAGSLFLGSPIGLAAGGTAMLLDLRSIAFPDTQFRPSFIQALPGSELALCGQQGPLPPHTRAAYVWASRIPNVPPPAIHIGTAGYIPANQKTPVPADMPDSAWKYLDRAREWTLSDSRNRFPIAVAKLGNQHAIELDLTKVGVPPGDYKLTALWDWQPFESSGQVHVLPLSDFSKAQLDPASQDRLLSKSGKVPVTLHGSDFEFTTNVQVEKLNDEFATPETVRFVLPKGLRQGPQDHMDVQLDTEVLDPGAYKLLITQQDGKSNPVPFKVLPNPPKIENLPILVNQESASQHFVLKGQHLDQLSKLEVTGAVLSLGPPESNGGERGLTVELKSFPRVGANLPVKAYIENRHEPIELSHALEITGPRPVIASVKLSLPKEIGISVHSDEIPAGYTLNAMLDVKNIDRQSIVRLACAEGVGDKAALHIGEQSNGWNLQQLSPDQLFVAFNTTSLPAGCSLQAVIDNGPGGSSRPFTLAHILRIPQVDSFNPADAPPVEKNRTYELKGQNLELIGKLGWSENVGIPVTGLAVPLPGPGLKQSIEVTLPEPSPGTPLYIWLRDDKQGRRTSINAPQPAPASTTTALSSSQNPSHVGQSMKLIAQVTPPTATGTVSFMRGQDPIGTSVLTSGEANLTVANLPAGLLPITAIYGGDANSRGSASAVLTQTVNKRPTTISIRSAPAPSTTGQDVTFTATVAAAPPSDGKTLIGTVTFKLGDTEIGTVTLDSAGTTTFTASGLKPGNYHIIAIYSGSAEFEGSTSEAMTHVVQ